MFPEPTEEIPMIGLNQIWFQGAVAWISEINLDKNRYYI